MTVSSSVNKVIYSGNSATVLFPVSYYFLENSHLKVILRAADGTETVQALTTNYTVTGAGNPAGGSVTMLVAPPTGTTLTIVRNVPATQETDYLANDPFPAESHERALDKLTMLVQENEEVTSRALVVPASTPTTVSTTLPNPSPLGILAWNQNANAINYISPSDIGTAVAYATAYADTFNCDGVDQTFTLTANPAVINNLDVSLQGSTQVPNVDYTLSGTTLTMTTPPPLNTVLLVKYKEGLPNYQGDSQDVRYVPAGTGAVATTVQAKLRNFVSTSDFGAVGDGVTDDTVAVQAAVDYCIANDLNLLVDGICLLTASVNIDRQVDGAAFDNYFIISSVNGGGFVVSTAIAMFSSSIPFTTAPVTQLTKFEDLVFSTTDNSLAAYVLNGARFLRVRFDNCSFQKIKLLVAPTYTQSIYLTNCNVRRFTGIFFDSQQYTYDFKMVNCLVEAGVSCLRLINPVGCAVTASCIEGMSGYAITYEAAQGLSISGCYFEANGLDIDGTDGGTSASNSYGVQLTGNYFSNATATYTVKWYAVLGSISAGNWHTGNMHDFTSSVKEVVVYDVAQGSVSNSSTMLNITGGYTVDVPLTLSGCTTSPVGNFRCNVNGDTVTISTPIVTGTSNTTAATLATLPTYLRPTVQQVLLARLSDNSATVLGILIIDTSGVITLAADVTGGAFTSSGTKGIQVNTLTYNLN